MSTNQSRILSIEEQIKALKEKKRNEILKLEKAVGKKFIEVFGVQNNSIQDITSFIDELKVVYDAANNTPADETNMIDVNNTK